jgi:endo-1,4-beta-xylanase
VVNEFIPASYGVDDVLLEALGPGYVDLAFQTARAADPAATLIYNCYDNETASGFWTPTTREIVDRLAGKGLIDAVGLQMHLDGSAPPDKADVVGTMRSYGLPVVVTEFDVNLKDVGGTSAQRLAAQAAVYRDMLEAALESGVCASFTTFGAGDKYSWIETATDYPGYSPVGEPTMFDDDLKPKPAYFAVRDALKAQAGIS